jgi:tetratricopeptide (TPR) repeat protein
MIRSPGWIGVVLLCLPLALAPAEEQPERPQAGIPGPRAEVGVPGPGAFPGQPPMPAGEHPAAHEGPLPIRDLSGHFELLPPVVGGLRSQDSAVRARCAFLLGQIGSRKTAGAVRPLLHDPSRAVRYQAGIALCSLSHDAGVPAAGAALASAAEWIRYYAVHALGDVATDRARTILETQRTGQPDLIAEQIDTVLGVWPQPTMPPARSDRPMGPYGSLHDLFIDAGGVYVVESDTHWHVGKYPQCVRCNETVTFLDPEYVEMYATSAWLLWSMGLDGRAVSVLRQGVDANPDDPEAWFNFGFHYMLKHEYATAARALGKAVELGVSVLGYRQYCHALDKSGHPDLALKEWQGLLETYPDDPIAPLQIARLKEVLGQG